MNTRRLALYLLPLAGALLQFCTEPSEPPRHETPPVSPGLTPVHLAVGNRYTWRVTEIGFGTFFQWNETSAISGDTVLAGRTYFQFDTGALLRSSGDTVFAFSHDSTTILYRLNVSVGEVVPFLGYNFHVVSIDTETVLGDTQTVVTVSNASTFSTGIVSGRYASRFGLVRLEQSDSLHVTTSSLWGARLGNTIYGSMP